MGLAKSLAAAFALIATAPIVAHAERGEHEEHEGRGGWDHRGGGDSWFGRREGWGEERREHDHWSGYSGSYYGGFGDYGYSPAYLSPFAYGYSTYYGGPYCSWRVQRFYEPDGDLVTRRVRVCR